MSEFKKGDKVIYVPGHAHGDVTHADCENGVVSSLSEYSETVFVKYNCGLGEALTGDEPWTSQGTSPEDLVSRR